MTSRDLEKGSSFLSHANEPYFTVPENNEHSDQVLSTTFPKSNGTTIRPSRANSPSRFSNQKDEASDLGQAANPANIASPEATIPAPDDDKQFIVGWDGRDDPMNPKNKSLARKWLIVIIITLGSFCVANCGSIYTTTYLGMNEEFGSSRAVATLGLSTFVFGLAVAPMILGPLSEFYGRKPIFIFSFLGFTIWLIPCAVAQNIETLLIVRFFDGFCGSAFLCVAGGTVGDIFTKETLQEPMMVYSASPFLGPATGPIVGGFINSNTNWRWTWYFFLIFSSVMTALIFIFVPETYMPVLLRKKAQMKRKETGDDRWKAPIEISDMSILWTVVHLLYRPFQLLLLDPMCFNLCLFSSILVGILYLFFGAFPLVYQNVYGFNLWQTGLTFVGLMVGMLLAIASDPFWHKNYLRQLQKREDTTGERKSEPEYRLPPSIVGSWFCTVGLFWFAWTIYPSVHWAVSIVGTAFFGFGIILVFSGIFTFLVEAYPLYAASALAANAFSRCSFAAAFPLFMHPMYETLDYHWATTVLAFLTLVMAPFPYIFFIYGKSLRRRSKYGSVWSLIDHGLQIQDLWNK